MKIKVLKVHDNGAIDFQIDKNIYYGCYPISIDEPGKEPFSNEKFSVTFEVKGVLLKYPFDPLGNIHIIKD